MRPRPQENFFLFQWENRHWRGACHAINEHFSTFPLGLWLCSHLAALHRFTLTSAAVYSPHPVNTSHHAVVFLSDTFCHHVMLCFFCLLMNQVAFFCFSFFAHKLRRVLCSLSLFSSFFNLTMSAFFCCWCSGFCVFFLPFASGHTLIYFLISKHSIVFSLTHWKNTLGSLNSTLWTIRPLIDSHESSVAHRRRLSSYEYKCGQDWRQIIAWFELSRKFYYLKEWHSVVWENWQHTVSLAWHLLSICPKIVRTDVLCSCFGLSLSVCCFTRPYVTFSIHFFKVRIQKHKKMYRTKRFSTLDKWKQHMYGNYHSNIKQS